MEVEDAEIAEKLISIECVRCPFSV
jgi:hypothetical protein